MTPDEWGAANRVYAETSGHPGPRDPKLTPYVIDFERAVHARTHKRVVLVISAQSGKSEALLDIIGERMDTAPVPMIYLGPSLRFLNEQWEPRVMELLNDVKTLSRKVTRGRVMKKFRKVVSGVPLRLAHGGSSSAVKSDPFGLALTDEADELMANVRRAGNPIDLIDARGDTYADFVHAIVSTPGEGAVETYVDDASGLEFWEVDLEREIGSTIWRLWQSGTQGHWAWPCPHCGEYFIPRFKTLKWSKPVNQAGKELPSTPEMAERTAHLQCPQGCADPILDSHKEEMNSRGVYVSPGQSITPDGEVHGEPPDSRTISYWVSGLASPFVTWSERAARYVTAVRNGDDVQAVINGGFGELYAPGGGEVPAWKEVAALASETYLMGQLPSDVQMITMAVDVQKTGLYFTVRGWGFRATSWLIEAGFLQGETAEEGVWDDLESLMMKTYGSDRPGEGMPISLTLIDSGFRPGKKEILPLNRIYEFCRRHKKTTRPTKGSSKVMQRPIIANAIDTNHRGVILHKSLDLYRLDTDHWKSWVHERIRWDVDQPGAWHLPDDITDDFCMQMVSEARVKKASGQPYWVQRSKDNHYFDCEAMQAAAGAMINAVHLRPMADVATLNRPRSASKGHEAAESRPGNAGGGWLKGEGSIW